MTADDLISDLVRDLEPVTPLPPPGSRALRWTLATVVASGLVIGVFGVRPDMVLASATIPFQAHMSLLVLTALTAAVAALTLAVPGEDLSRWRRALPVLATMTWGLWLAAQVLLAAAGDAAALHIDAGWHCITLAMAVGAVPAAMLFRMVSRGAVLDGRKAAMFAGLAGAGVGAIGVELICPKIAPMHLIVWHAVPALTFTVTAGLAGASALRALHADGAPLS